MLTTLAVGLSLACGVPSAQAEYETPEVQVYVRGSRLVACHRATGRERRVGVRANDGMGTDESTYVNAVIAQRWLWTSTLSTFAESADVRDDELTDLQTGQRVAARVQDEDTDGQAVASIGVLVTTGNGVTARYTGGRTVKLSTDSNADALAQNFERVYWREGGVAKSATLDIQVGGDLRPRPRARTIGRCKPRPGARLILRDGKLVITRAGGAVWGCRGSRTRRIATARLLGDFAPVGDRLVAYNRAGTVGTLDLVSGKRRELPGSGFAADGTTLLAGGDLGLRAFPNRPLAPGPATEPALSSDLDGTVAYWLDGAGTPQVASL